MRPVTQVNTDLSIMNMAMSINYNYFFSVCQECNKQEQRKTLVKFIFHTICVNVLCIDIQETAQYIDEFNLFTLMTLTHILTTCLAVVQ